MTPEKIAELRAAAESLPSGYDYVLEKDEILALLDHIDQVRAAVIEECAKVCDRNATDTVDDSEMWTAEACARDIRALALPAVTEKMK